MGHWPLSLAIAALAACSGPAPSGNDAGDTSDAVACEPYSAVQCSEGDVFWSDGCGNLFEQLEDCGVGERCDVGARTCCTLPPASGTVPAYPWPVVAHWRFSATSAAFVVDIDVDADPGESNPMSVDILFRIDGVLVFFALENWLPADPNTTSTKGIRFYRGGTPDIANARTTTGVIENSELGDGEVRIRYPLVWTQGQHFRFRFVRAEADGAADWFELFLTVDQGTEELLGGLRLPRAEAGTPATVTETISTYFKVTDFVWSEIPPLLGGVVADYSDFATIDARFEVAAADRTLLEVTSAYGTDAADSEWLNTEASYVDGQVRQWFGRDAARCTPDGQLR